VTPTLPKPALLNAERLSGPRCQDGAILPNTLGGTSSARLPQRRCGSGSVKSLSEAPVGFAPRAETTKSLPARSRSSGLRQPAKCVFSPQTSTCKTRRQCPTFSSSKRTEGSVKSLSEAPVAGEEQRMREPYGEGVASRTGPESCLAGCEAVGEALTGVPVGRVLSRESIESVWGADAVEIVGRRNRSVAIARPVRAPRGRRPRAHSEALCAGTGRSHVRSREMVTGPAS
jgi:hypothetical protein